MTSSPSFGHALCAAGEVDIETCGLETRLQIGSFGMQSTKDTPEDAA